jgi:hypothetical protein
MLGSEPEAHVMKKIFSALSSLAVVSPITSTVAEVKVPATELKVLAFLRAQELAGKPTHGPAIARASNGAISVASIYKLLDRLCARGLVTRNTETIQVDELDAGFKRVSYRSTSH